MFQGSEIEINGSSNWITVTSEPSSLPILEKFPNLYNPKKLSTSVDSKQQNPKKNRPKIKTTTTATTTKLNCKISHDCHNL